MNVGELLFTSSIMMVTLVIRVVLPYCGTVPFISYACNKYVMCCFNINIRIHQLVKTKNIVILTINEPIAKVVCFSRLLKYLRSLYGKSVNPDQTATI